MARIYAVGPIPVKAKITFQVGFMDLIPETTTKRLTSDTTFSYHLLIVDAYSKIPKLYDMERKQ